MSHQRKPDRKAVPICAALAVTSLTFADRGSASPGDLDPAFGDGGRVSLTELAQSSPGDSMTQQADGKLVLVSTIYVDNHARRVLTRLNTDGTLDASFGSDGVAIGAQPDESAAAVIQQTDGKLVVAGDAWSEGDDAALWRFDSSGALDLTFGDGGKVSLDLGAFERATGLVQQTDGKLVIVGTSETSPDGGGAWLLARFNADGGLDATFGSGGSLIAEVASNVDLLEPVAIIQQPDGRFVVTGSSRTDDGTGLIVASITQDGALDPSFGMDGVVAIAADEIRPVPAGHRGFVNTGSAALQDDGRILLMGRAGDAVCCDDWGEFIVRSAGFLLRLAPEGALDSTFGTSGISIQPQTFSSVVIQPDGKIVTAFSDLYNMGLMRFNSDGTADDSFGIAGVSIADFGSLDQSPLYHTEAMLRQTDGKFVLLGSYAIVNTDLGWYPALARFGDESTGFPGLIGLTWSEVNSYENAQLTVAVRRTGGSTGAVGVSFETTAGSATDGSDFMVQLGQLDWADGDTSEKTITLELIDDTNVEADTEQFGLHLMSPTGGAKLTLSIATISIFDNDTATDPLPEPPPPTPTLPDPGGGGGREDALWLVLLIFGLARSKVRL